MFLFPSSASSGPATQTCASPVAAGFLKWWGLHFFESKLIVSLQKLVRLLLIILCGATSKQKFKIHLALKMWSTVSFVALAHLMALTD